MENITSVVGLKNAIQRLEVEQALDERLLKEQFYFTYQSLKPINLLRSTLNEAASSPHLINNVLGTAVGLATGYLSRKIVIGVSGNIIRKLFGFVLQLGVTNAVAQHPGTIKSLGQSLFHRILGKKENVLPQIKLNESEL